MALSSTTNKVTYTGSGTTGPFDFTFKIFATSEIAVDKYTIATEATETLVETTDYTVTIDGENGGEVNLVATLSSAYKLVIRRVLPLTQEIDYVENDPFPAATHEEALDRAAMRDQQLQEQVDRAVKVPVGSSTDPDGLITSLTAAADAAVAAQAAAELAQTGAETAQALAEAAAGTTGSMNLIIDGGGAALTTGVKLDVTIPFDCTIEEVKLLADQTGSIVIDIWKDTYANYPPTVADTITASAKPTLSSATKYSDATLTGWTTTITAGNTLRINIDSITTITRVCLHLKVRKT
jgi:hypothetical protein